MRQTLRYFQPDSQLRHCSEENSSQLTPTGNLAADLAYIQQLFTNDSDFSVQYLEIDDPGKLDCCFLYLDSMVDRDSLSHMMSKAVQLRQKAGQLKPEDVMQTILSMGKVEKFNDLNLAAKEIAGGKVVVLTAKSEGIACVTLKGPSGRSIEEAPSESVIRGPRDGFVEDIRTNTNLIRRRIKSPKLKFQQLTVGELTETSVSVAYIEGIVDLGIVEEIKRRLQRIIIDGILESGYLEEFIEDTPASLFPQIMPTERPDRVAEALLSGRGAILVDNTPYVLIVPVTFPYLIQSAEDYYERFVYTSFIRLLRYITLNISLILPAFYIAVGSFHQDILPTKLLISFARTREELPLPLALEVFMLEFIFEMIREAGVRLPRQVGSAVSIVGALVIGDAAIKAGLVSPVTVMVVASTAIANLTIPTIAGANSIRLTRFVLMLAATFFGLMGIVVSLIVILAHLASIRSFGIPYLAPLAPTAFSDLKDSFIRAPHWLLSKRPMQLAKHNQVRQANNNKGEPPKSEH
ncbi:spore germination protein [Desulfosporosinus sp. PR]|nr:spore germination protein [Desulfosporosinus sp. PR]